MNLLIRTIYLYLFALVGLFLFVFSTVSLVGAVLDRYVWPQEFVRYDYQVPVAEKQGTTLTLEEQREEFAKQQNNEFKRRINQSAPGAVVGWLLWWFHWNWIKRDRRQKREEKAASNI